MNSALTKFLQLAAEAGLLTTIASEHLDSQFNYYEDPRDMAERCETVPEQASEDQLQDPNMVEERGRKDTTANIAVIIVITATETYAD